MKASAGKPSAPVPARSSLHPGGTGRQVGQVRGLLLLGVLAFLGFCVAFAPARLLAPLAERIDGAALTGTAGTVWSGSGRLIFKGQDRGRFSWSFQPATLLRLFPGIGWTLSAEHMNLAGSMNLAPARAAVSVSGTVDSDAVNPWLAAYELSMAGKFELRDLRVHVTDDRPDDTRGTISWSGGRLRYVLSQRSQVAELPPLEARLSFSDGPEATVVAAGDATPLLEARLLDSGFARIGVTMLLTRMLGQPWPGGGPDDKVVLAVEEKIL